MAYLDHLQAAVFIIIIIIINAKIKVTLNTNVAGALYKNYPFIIIITFINIISICDIRG